MTDPLRLPDPVVELTEIHELADDLVVIGDRRVELVPNVGIIGGREAVLVIDTGMGPANAETVLGFATEFANGRKLYLTTTHFHPEHAFGADTFRGAATYLVNRAQADDLKQKGDGYLAWFREFGGAVAARLAGVVLPEPDMVYNDSYELDLGGRIVRMRGTGRAHSKGDQVVEVPGASVLFTGDLVEAAHFAIFPWFPPHDTDVSGLRWIEVMDRLAAFPPRIVVPGHGDIGGPQLLSDVADYLRLLRDETWIRRDSAMSEETIAEEITALMIQRHPDWAGREWIRNGVGCTCAEHELHRTPQRS
ncbi:MBL fold metallo-hydrolase [Nocardia sp. NPDC057440]|uniref:MBL fold metallo-hydrolase n=1 Tax=Nocardia sp. NPDC057440 TaxID=3346134 RepID=UPI00366E0339